MPVEPGGKIAAKPKPRWSLSAKITAGVFGLGLLGWPFFSFGAIFMFDAPLQGPADEIERYAFVYLTWGYPLLYGLAWLGYHLLSKRAVSEKGRMAMWLLPAAVPLYYLWFFGRGR